MSEYNLSASGGLPVYLQEGIPGGIVVKIKAVWSYLFLKSARGMDSGLLANRLGLRREEIDNIELIADRIREIIPRSRRGFRHRMARNDGFVSMTHNENLQERLLCPPWPNGRNKDIMNQYAPKVWAFFETNRKFLLDILVLFVKNSWNSRNELIFHHLGEADSAIMYMRFLRKLGIRKKALRFIDFNSHRHSPYRNKWQEKLNLTRQYKVYHVEAPNRESNAPGKWFGIAPTFPNEKGTMTTSAGFRFLIIMTAIYANYKGYKGISVRST